MIVPSTRLVVMSAVVLLPLGGIAMANPDAMMLAGGLFMLFLSVLLVDAVLSPRRLVGIGIHLPEVVRLQKDRPGEVEIQISNPSKRSLHLRLGLPFPEEITTEMEDFAVALPDGAPVSRVKWPCLPLKRGVYAIDTCYVEGKSPMGLWAVRSPKPCHAEVRVYPDLFNERRRVAALFLNRGHYGIHARRMVGKGREFEKLREYNPGDSLNDVHWKASAKRGHLVTKVFQTERTQEVYAVIDSSRLSARADALERAVTATLLLALAAEQQGDLFGIVGFNDKVNQFVRARSGKAHFDACREAIYTLQPKIVSPDFDELTSFIRTRLRKRALLVFLTALDDPLLAESFSRNLELISGQHLILVNMIKPPGVQPLFSTGVGSVSEIYEKLGGHLQWNTLRELDKKLRRRGVRFNLLDNEGMCAEIVGQYMEIKARQLI